MSRLDAFKTPRIMHVETYIETTPKIPSAIRSFLKL